MTRVRRMTPASRRCLTLTLATVTATAALGAPAKAEAGLAPEERSFVAATLYAATLQTFAHAQAVPGLDLERSFRAYLREALQAPDRRGFDLASVAFLAGLRNGHTYFYDHWLNAQDAGPLGFRLEHRREGYVVTASRRPGLRPGDRVEALDGRPIDAVIAGVRRYVSASSANALPFELFAGWQPYLFPARFTLRLAGGHCVAIDRSAKLAPQPEPHTEARWLAPGRIAYMKLPSFQAPGYEADALALLPRYAAARALVLDLRGNDGGTSPSRLLTALMNRPYRNMAFTTPMHVGLLDAYESSDDNAAGTAGSPRLQGSLADLSGAGLSWTSPYFAAAPGAFAGKLYLLTDGWCYSACETFLAPFKDNGRGTLVGERTEGSTGQTYEHEFPNGMGFHIGAKRARMPDGSPFEGIGIAPDVPIGPTADDMARGHDVVLQRAIDLATNS